jgi:hypothetical protein
MKSHKQNQREYVQVNTCLILIIILFLLTCGIQLKAQSYPQFQNPSLEDASGVNVTPWGYTKCTVGGPSSPDIQPGIWNVFLQPSNGFSYVGMICRPNGTWESFTTQLNTSLWGGTQYAFLVDLASSNKYFGYNDSAATLKIWGGNANCDKGYLLWESKPISNVNYWRTDTASFTTREKNITHLVFEPGYTSAMPYKGNILIDNFRPFNGTLVGIEDINLSNKTNEILFDILGRKIKNYDLIPCGSIYIKNKKKHIKL